MKNTVTFVVLFVCTMPLLAQTPSNTGSAPANRAAVPGARAPRTPRYVDPSPYNFNDHAGWQSMFDGSTLNGWNGPEGVWRVEDGAIVASSSAQNPLGSVYLLWGGGEVKDFEMKAEIKLEGSGANSGVQFRAQMLGKTEKKDSEWESFGYQADYDYVNEQTGALIECCAGPGRGPKPRPFKASPGMFLRETASDPDNPTIVASLGEGNELKKLIHTGDWNQLHIVARGTVLMYILNGHVMSMVEDDNPSRFLDHGTIELQLEGKGDTKVSFRNLWIKKLP